MIHAIADYRSDTLTSPTPAMRDEMASAMVGDDVYGEDPTINTLESRVAELTGKEAAIFAPSGTQSNLLALLAHCERGDEYIVGQEAHTYKYEGGGAAILGSIQPQPLDFSEDGSLDLEKVAGAIKPDDSHFANTRLLCLENTNNGRPLSLEYQASTRNLCDSRGLSLHLDGARAFNAAVTLGVELETITQFYDSVSLCFSKGLGAPVGSVLCGSQAFIARARRWRKVVGGGLRQAGILGAACIYALDNNIERLATDHANAAALAEGLRALPDFTGQVTAVDTNMVHLEFSNTDEALNWGQALKKHGIIVPDSRHIRLVTHLDISSAAIDATLEATRSYLL